MYPNVAFALQCWASQMIHTYTHKSSGQIEITRLPQKGPTLSQWATLSTHTVPKGNQHVHTLKSEGT